MEGEGQGEGDRDILDFPDGSQLESIFIALTYLWMSRQVLSLTLRNPLP
jgi:hypothetical protein